MTSYLINTRWLNIPEDDIYRLFVGRGDVWGQKKVPVGGQTRYYLSSESYAYSYSLPVEVIERLAERLNRGRLMLNHARWYEVMKANPGHNDTGGQIVVRTKPGATWKVLGVHLLTEEERGPVPMIFFDVRCKTGNRDSMQPVYWEWTNMLPYERPGPAFVDKPPYEVGALNILAGVAITMWMNDGGRVSGFEGDDSYFVIFQEVDNSIPPDPDPDPDPDPPVPSLIGHLSLKVNKAHINTLPIDDQGNIEIVLPIYTENP